MNWYLKPFTLFMFVIVFTQIPVQVYADESTFEEPVLSVFDWLDEVFQSSIDSSDLNNGTKNNLNDTLDAGIDAGKQGTKLWFKIHGFVKALIFTGAYEAGFDESSKDLIAWVAIIAVFAMMLSIAKKLMKENAKIAMIVIGILIALGISGIVIEF